LAWGVQRRTIAGRRRGMYTQRTKRPDSPSDRPRAGGPRSSTTPTARRYRSSLRPATPTWWSTRSSRGGSGWWSRPGPGWTARGACTLATSAAGAAPLYTRHAPGPGRPPPRAPRAAAAAAAGGRRVPGPGRRPPAGWLGGRGGRDPWGAGGRQGRDGQGGDPQPAGAGAAAGSPAFRTPSPARPAGAAAVGAGGRLGRAAQHLRWAVPTRSRPASCWPARTSSARSAAAPTR
jgi:hypothetical protein